jgi:hypothetical protein
MSVWKGRRPGLLWFSIIYNGSCEDMVRSASYDVDAVELVEPSLVVDPRDQDAQLGKEAHDDTERCLSWAGGERLPNRKYEAKPRRLGSSWRMVSRDR